MGWGIYLYPEIYYSKVNYRSKDDVEDEIDTVKKIIKSLEDRLILLAATTEPNKMMSKEDIDEGISPLDWVDREIKSILDDDSEANLKDYYFDLYRLEMLRNYWDSAHNKDGKAVAPPKGSFKYPREAYMDGDFIESVYEDGTNTEEED